MFNFRVRQTLELSRKCLYLILCRRHRLNLTTPVFSNHLQNMFLSNGNSFYSSILTATDSYSGVDIHDVLKSVHTPTGLLNVVDKHLPHYQNQQILQTLNIMEKLMYQSLIDKYPWTIRHSKRMMCVQSFISNECHKFFVDTMSNDTMQRLLDFVIENNERLSNEELSTITRHLVRLHVDPSSKVLCSLLTRCIERCHTFDIKCLRSLAICADHLGRSGFYLSSLILKNISDNWNTLPLTSENYENFATILSYVGYFCPVDFLNNVAMKLTTELDFTTKEMKNLNPKCSFYLLEILVRFGGAKSRQNALKFLSHLEESLDKLPLTQLHKIIIYLKLLRNQNHDLITKISQLANDKIKSNNLTPVEVVALIGIFDTIGYPQNSFNRLENLFIDNISMFDSILLKDISRPNFLVLTKNETIVNLFCKRVLECMPDITNSIACLINIINVIPKFNSYPTEFDAKFGSYILNQIQNGQIGLQIDNFHVFCRYLLHCSGNSGSGYISPVLSETLLPVLPKMPVHGLLNLNDEILKLQNRTPHPHRYEFIRRSILRSLIDKLTEISHINGLNSIIRQFTLYELQKHYPNVIPNLVDKYINFVSGVTTSNVRLTSSCIAEMKLYIPEILQRLVDCVLAQGNLVNLNVITEVLRALSSVNFIPDKMNLLQNLFVSVCNQNDPDLNLVDDVILSTSALATLGFFPETILTKIFSLDFLLKFDNYCAGLKKSRAQLLKQKLSVLNRSVILRQPNLNVPWFHEDFCRQLYTLSNRTSYSHWKNEVREKLSFILDDKSLIRDKNVLSDYYHRFDIEISLSSSEYQCTAENQKIAILVLGPMHFCSNTHQMLGTIAAKINELEILEYKVVTIPYYDLDSMELSNETAMINYLKKCLFGESCA